jgi:hypothetical protein
MYDWFFKRYVTPQMKKSIVTLLAAWLLPFFKFSAIGIVLSTCFFYWQVIIDHRCRSAVVTHYLQSNCLMRNRCGLLFKSKSWKFTVKFLKICYGNPTFFRSITWNQMYPISISWHYPIKTLGRTKKNTLVAITPTFDISQQQEDYCHHKSQNQFPAENGEIVHLDWAR